MVQEAQNVRHWLMSNYKISVPGDWLEACIEWIHSESEVTEITDAGILQDGRSSLVTSSGSSRH